MFFFILQQKIAPGHTKDHARSQSAAPNHTTKTSLEAGELVGAFSLLDIMEGLGVHLLEEVRCDVPEVLGRDLHNVGLRLRAPNLPLRRGATPIPQPLRN